MSNKDLIIRVSGTKEKAEDFLSQVVEEAQKLGLLPINQSIRAVPDKVRKIDVRNKNAKDIKISVIGDESKVEAFLEAVIQSITDEASLPNPSTNLVLEKN